MNTVLQLHFWLYTHSEWFREYGDAVILGIIVGVLISLI